MTGSLRSRYSSRELFHFVGRHDPRDHERNYRILQNVIRQRCVSHPPHNPGWGTMSIRVDPSRSLVSEELVVPTVTCYCDIPFEQLEIHVAKYGSFGLSFDRRLLVKYGARPVAYVPTSPQDRAGVFGATMLEDIECVYRAFRTLVGDKIKNGPKSRSLKRDPSTVKEALTAMNSIIAKDFLAFIKPFNSTLEDDSADNFYMEREWRKFGNFCFDVGDLNRVVVESTFVDRVRDDLPEIAHLVHAAPRL